MSAKRDRDRRARAQAEGRPTCREQRIARVRRLHTQTRDLPDDAVARISSRLERRLRDTQNPVGGRVLVSHTINRISPAVADQMISTDLLDPDIIGSPRRLPGEPIKGRR